MSKNVIITGANGNLGKVVTNSFAHAGFTVHGTVRSESNSPEKNIRLYQVDLLDTKSTENFIGSLKSTVGSIHSAIFLAGGFAMGNIRSTTKDDLMKMYELNFMTVFNLVKPIYAWMKEKGGGNIVMVGAKPAIEGDGAHVLAYALSKGSVVQLAELLNETGKADNINISVIIPSIIDTPLNRKEMPNANFDDWVTPEVIAENILHLVSSAGRKLRNQFLKIYGKV